MHNYLRKSSLNICTVDVLYYATVYTAISYS